MNHVVIGLGFGDEGKGLATSYLCERFEGGKIVVRFNGGHQAGHTVVHRGVRHVFSSWGSGTLQGVPTYWSKNCTFYPTAFLNEMSVLISKMEDDLPSFFAHTLCPVTTPYDVKANRERARANGHGSVGVGFGTTLERHEKFHKLHLQDLLYEKILREKLRNIRNYYGYGEFEDADLEIENFIQDCKEAINIVKLHTQNSFLKRFEHVIFEGAQGVMLDQDFGFFPNVTRSNTTSKNVVDLLKEIDQRIDKIWYITRSYQTRHGNGYMSNEGEPLDLKNNEKETNISHDFQGNFRVAPLDPELLSYAINCDSHYTGHDPAQKNLIITCNDQATFPLKINDVGTDNYSLYNVDGIWCSLFSNILFSYSDETTSNLATPKDGK